MPAKSERSEANPRPSFVRVGVIVLVALAASSAYLTRHCIAVANTSIQAELGIDEDEMGWVFAAFSVGYFLCQIPGGWLGNRIGTRSALSSFSMLWSLLAIWTAAVSSFVPLFCSRLTFGMAQAGLVPNSARIIRDWMPDHRRGISSALISASMSVGGVITMGLTAWLMNHLHWRDIFRIYSLVGIVWAIVFYAWFRTRPEDHPWVNDAELDLIGGRVECDATGGSNCSNDGLAAGSPSRTDRENSDSGRDREVETAASLIARMFRCRSVWAICSQSFFRAAGYGLFVSWFPALLEYRYALSPEQAGTMTMCPLAGVIVGSLAGGLLVDLLLKRTGSKRISRSGVAVFALAASGLLTLCSAWTASAWTFVSMMSAAATFSGLGSPPAWAAGMDISGRHTAVMMGTQNMAGTAGAFMMPVVLGYLIGNIKQTGGDWNLVIYFVSVIYVAGAVCWLAVNPNKGIEA